MATVIATINLKGGVGKTTTTVAIAEMLSVEHRKRVLVIDLDPQTNATTILIGEDKWEKLNDEHQTLAQLFKDALLDGAQEREFELERALQKQVSPVREVLYVDLLPSSIDLIDVQDRLASMPVGQYYSRSPTDILYTAIKNIIDEYDYVLIDCPPNLGIITLNGLRVAQGYIIPAIPDVLSTYGIPQIVTRVAGFAAELNEPIKPYGIVVSKYREQSSTHSRTLRDLRQRNSPPVFETVIPEGDAIAKSAEYTRVNTLRQKYSYGDRYDRFRDLTEEIMNVAG